jgi:hypothetical protein
MPCIGERENDIRLRRGGTGKSACDSNQNDRDGSDAGKKHLLGRIDGWFYMDLP